MLSRRDFIHAGCAIAAAPLLGGWRNGSAPFFIPSQRSALSIDPPPGIGGIGDENYAFINHILFANYSFVGTVAGFNAGLDANGWATHALNGSTQGGSFFIPDSQNWPASTGGYYIVAGKGSGTFFFNVGGPWSNRSTTPPAVGSITINSGSSYTIVDTNGAGWQIALNFTGDGTGNPQFIQYRISGTDQNNNGQNLRALQFYRSVDAADLAAGNIFRSDYKQDLVNYRPSAIRFLNWHSPNNSIIDRWETRILPTNATYISGWTSSLPYLQATDTGTPTNQFSVASVTGMPVQVTHGELVTCQFASGYVRCNGNSIVGSTGVITAITKANPGQATVPSHGFNTGDHILHVLNAADGMAQLNQVVCIVTVIDANNYTLGIDTTGFSTFSNVSPNQSFANQNTTLNVGARGAYPIMYNDGGAIGSTYGNNYVQANNYQTFVFDAYIVGNNGVTGAWLYTSAGAGTIQNALGFATPIVPVEVCTKLVIEVNALAVSQGATQTIDMFLNVPTFGMSSLDSALPGYSSASNYAVNAVQTALNGANGYPGLLTTKANLWLEHDNENWNPTNACSSYFATRGFLRWGSSGNNFSSFSTLIAMIMCKDVQAATSSSNRIKYVLSGQGAVGYAAGNVSRCQGTTVLNTDSANPLLGNVGTAIYPIMMFTAFAWAAYIQESSSWSATNLTTIANQWLANAGNAAAQEANCASYLVGMTTDTSGNSQSIAIYTTLLTAYASAMRGFNKLTINYGEGGKNWSTTGNTGSTNNQFLYACGRSQAWATAQINFFNLFATNPSAAMPSIFDQMGARFGYTTPDAYGVGNGGTAGVYGSGYDKTWNQLGVRNQALP